MEDEMNKVEISQSLLNIYQKSKLAAYSPHSEYYAVRKEFKGNFISFSSQFHPDIKHTF